MLTVDEKFTNVEQSALPEDSPELLSVLMKRKRRNMGLKLSDKERTELELRVVNDVFDAAGTNQAFRGNHVEFLNNWRGTPEPASEDHPLGELAANVKVPLTSTFIEQWKARLSKIILGEGNIARFYSEVENLDEGVLKKISDWFNWELRHIVNIDKVLNDVMHYVLVDGICLSVPNYDILHKRIISTREFELDENKPLSVQIEGGVTQCFSSLGYTVESINLTTTPGMYEVDVATIDTAASVTVLMDNGALVFELEYDETVFDGVRVDIPNIEDVIVVNSDECVNKIPFLAIRSFMSAGEFEERFENGEFPILDKAEVETIISMAGPKTQYIVPMDNTEEQDLLEGGDSTGEASARSTEDLERQWIEIYRWEGTIKYKGHRVGVCAWVAAQAQKLFKLHRLEELNKDGLRTCIKHDFIPVPGRFYSLGMCELLRHSQTEIDGIHNFRLNSALVSTVPFGFYEPQAGMPHTIIGLKPGSLYPVKRADGINFPNIPWNSVWGFQEENLTRQYGSELAGMGDPGVGTYTSKRTSATEFAGTAQALDIRTEHIARIILASVEKLFYRIFSLYQQHAKNERVYIIAGKDGSELVQKLEPDLLQGRLKLQLTGNIRQLSKQLEQDRAMQMIGVLVNEFAIQMGIVRPDTVYAAIAKVMEAAEYKGVPIYKPQTEPDSPSPEDEVAMMYAGVYPEPHIGEDFGMHLQDHIKLSSHPELGKILPPEGQLLLQRHIQETTAMYQQVMMLRQQQAMQAQGMQNQLGTMGVRPGEAGGTTAGGMSANAGTQDEGVASDNASLAAT